MTAVFNTGQAGLESLRMISSPETCGAMKENGLRIGDIMKGTLGGKLNLTAAIEVYEDQEDKSLSPVLLFSSILEDSVFRVRELLLRRNRFPTQKRRFSTEVKDILNPSAETRMAYAIEAATDLLPKNVDQYGRPAV